MRFCSDDSSERRESSSPIVRWGILSLLVVTSDLIYRLAWRISLTPLWSDATLVTVVRITLASTSKKRKHLTSSVYLCSPKSTTGGSDGPSASPFIPPPSKGSNLPLDVRCIAGIRHVALRCDFCGAPVGAAEGRRRGVWGVCGSPRGARHRCGQRYRQVAAPQPDSDGAWPDRLRQ